MKPRYEPKTTNQFLGYLIEECGEVLAAAGKSLRWGLRSANPELPPSEQETNAAWLRREMDDLQGAIERMRKHLNALDGEMPDENSGDAASAMVQREIDRAGKFPCTLTSMI